MTTDYKGALDEIFTALNNANNNLSASIIGYVPPFYIPGMVVPDIPDAAKFWARISTQNVRTDQATLAENVVINGSRRYENNGLVFVQWFAPKRADSESKCLALSQMVLNVLRKRTNNVILRNARIQELSPENGAIRKNIVAEFQFDEIG